MAYHCLVARLFWFVELSPAQLFTFLRQSVRRIVARALWHRFNEFFSYHSLQDSLHLVFGTYIANFASLTIRDFLMRPKVFQYNFFGGRERLVPEIFLGLAIAYFCMPFDLRPDFIPVIGHLDDAVIIPALVFVALRSVPHDLVSEHREQVIRRPPEDFQQKTG